MFKELYWPLLLLLLSVVIIPSCITELPIDYEHNRKVVVNCILTDDSLQTLSLLYSSEVGDYSFTEVKNAEVELYKDSIYVGSFERESYGTWILAYRPEKGAEYNLLVNIKDSILLRATTTMPVDNEINPLTTEDWSRTYTQQTADFPCWIFCVGHVGGVATKVYSYPNEEFSLSTYTRTNHPLADNFNQQEAVDSLLSFLYYIRIKNVTDNEFSPVGFIVGKSTEFIFFRTTSFEYDQYLKTSLSKINICLPIDDPSDWFDESAVYTNIENGTGIFGACSDHYFFYLWQELTFEMKDNKFIYY
jgi:hypothetical protein